jgi:shikimate dehydrogenase
VSLKGARVLLLGAGGARAASCCRCSTPPREITIVNRTAQGACAGRAVRGPAQTFGCLINGGGPHAVDPNPTT